MKRRYFDWAATAIPFDFNAEVPFGNPSSRHHEGKAARGALEDARRRCAAILEVDPACLYWTSGGTESNALVLSALVRRRCASNGAALAGATEHASIRAQDIPLRAVGTPFYHIGAEADGTVSPEKVKKALEKHPDARLVALMHVNNETGAINDLARLVQAVRESSGAHIHSDMVQSLGKLSFSLACLGLDSAAFSAHKIGGPRGIGLLYLKKPLETLFRGGGQERGVRGGTENVWGALFFADCLERRAASGIEDGRMAAEERMARLIGGMRRIEGSALIPESRAERDARFSPFIVQAAFSGIPGEVMARSLDETGFAVSTGAACSSAEKKRPVLEAMGVSAKTAFEAFRVSQGWSTTEDDIDALLAALQNSTRSLRS
jgi:cysteine desulfurase